MPAAQSTRNTKPPWVRQVQWSLFLSALVAVGAAAWLAFTAPTVPAATSGPSHRAARAACVGLCGLGAHAGEIIFLLLVAAAMVLVGLFLPAFNRRAERRGWK